MYVRLVALTLALLAPALAGAQSLYSEGQHYRRIDPPVPTQAAEGKVEVVEVFSYACVHCANFEPFVTAWKKSLPGNVEFQSMPAVFNPTWEALARTHHALRKLDAVDRLHPVMFKAIHQDRKPLTNLDAIAGFLATQDIDREAFLAAAQSEETSALLQRERERAMGYRLEGTPSVVVNGKYLVSAGSAGGFQGMLQVVDFLIGQEAGAGR
jgi:thiol:disulfide interchange protein DsbA